MEITTEIKKRSNKLHIFVIFYRLTIVIWVIQDNFFPNLAAQANINAKEREIH